jgi:hypothetical protein
MKNRGANRAAQTAAVRIAELDEQLVRLEKNVASQAAPANAARRPNNLVGSV